MTHEELGGAGTHTGRSGVADQAFENDVEALTETRRFIDFLPPNNREQPPRWPTTDPVTRAEPSLDRLVPANPNKPYDMRELIAKVVGRGRLFRAEAFVCAEHHHRLRPHRW